MKFDSKLIAEELGQVDRLIGEGCLQLRKPERIAKLAEHGMTGLACADGRYNKATADFFSKFHWMQHLLKLNGTGFLLGLDPSEFDGHRRQYLEAAQFALLYDLEVAFKKLLHGRTVILLSHSPNCGQRAHFGLNLEEMLLATHRAHDRVVETLGVDHKIVIPALMVDRTYGVTDPAQQEVELYVIKHDLIRRNGS